MTRPRRKNPVALALWANAILLGGILIALLARGGNGNLPAVVPAAFGQQQGPIAGGAGMFVMPCQLAERQWGAYLMDIDAGTLAVYQYEPGVRQLRFVAVRYFRNDTKLHDMSTSPPTEEIRKLVEKQNQGFRGGPDNAPPPQPDAPKEP
jgi:hypothetical protein